MGPKRKQMTPEQKEVAINLHLDGRNQRYIADVLGISQSGVSKFLKRYGERENIENKARSGRPSLCDDRVDRKILRCMKGNRRTPLNELTSLINVSLPRKLSSRTVRRRLSFHGFSRRKVRKVITISPINRKLRVAWCKGRLHRTTNNYWKRVIFSDETQVVVDRQKCVSVWRRPNEVWRPECLGQRGGRKISVMFWGCVTYSGVGTLVPVEGTINSAKYISILDDNLWPVITKNFTNNDWIFQDDNAPVHASRETKRWKLENELKCMTWPSQSPDINIIENIWRTLKIQLEKEIHNIRSRDDLIQTVTRLWTSLSLHYVQSLYQSIPTRLRHVIISKGHITKY